MTSVIVVTNTAEDTAGSTPEPVERHRHEDPAKARGKIVDDHRRAHHRAEQRVAEDERDPGPDQHAERQAVGKRDRQLAPERPQRVRFGQLVGRERAHRDRQRLGPGIAAHPGDDRHQHREHRIFADLALEQADHAGGEDRGAEVDHQPEQAPADGQPDRLVDVAFARAGEQQDVLAGFLLDDVDDVVDGDHADQPPGVVDHRGRNQRIFLEAERDVFLVHVDRDQRLLARHDLADRRRCAGCAGSSTACRCRPGDARG